MPVNAVAHQVPAQDICCIGIACSGASFRGRGCADEWYHDARVHAAPCGVVSRAAGSVQSAVSSSMTPDPCTHFIILLCFVATTAPTRPGKPCRENRSLTRAAGRFLPSKYTRRTQRTAIAHSYAHLSYTLAHEQAVLRTCANASRWMNVPGHGVVVSVGWAWEAMQTPVAQVDERRSLSPGGRAASNMHTHARGGEGRVT